MIQRTRPSEKTADRSGLRILGLIVILGLSVAASLYWRTNPLPERAAGYAQQVATTSAATYVTLRTLNAVLSTVQEAAFTGSVVVAEATVQPLKALEPIDDTVERISDVVFAIMLTAGVLSVAMGPVSAVGAAMVGLACLIWLGDLLIGRRDPIIALSRRLVWYGAFLGLGLPMAFLISAQLADLLTASVWDTHTEIIETIMADVGANDVAPITDSEGWLAWLRELSQDVDRYYTVADNALNHANELIGSFIAILSVYVFKIFLLPTLIAGALFVLARFFASGPDR